MKSKSNTPTMKDVAREAGVALGTVSKVFNGIPVGEKYRVRVETAAEKLGYQVNNYARGMRTNKTQTVAIIMPVINHPFFSSLTEALSCELTRYNYTTYISVTDWDPEAEKKAINMVAQKKVDGIIALTYRPVIRDFSDIPFVSIDRSFGGAVPCISSDNFGGGEIAAATLSELGCKKLLFIRTGTAVPGEPDKRGSGFIHYCTTHGIEHDVLSSSNEPGYEELFAALRKKFAEKSFDYDGIFCSTDTLAVQVLNILSFYHVKVPRDVQVIGYDGVKDHYTGDYVCSTIVQPIDQIAKVAVKTLLSRDAGTQTGLICLPVHYAYGGTTKEKR